MYQYAPKPKKQTEKLICVLLVFLATFCYTASVLFEVLFPALLQLLSFVCLTVAIFFASGYLLRSYVYRIEENPNSSTPDFTVTELCGKRRTVVCRVSLEEIVMVEPLTAANQKALSQKTRENPRYDYTATLSPEGACWLTVMQNGTPVSVKILTDEGLFRFFSLV